jgi:hypothetical protein
MLYSINAVHCSYIRQQCELFASQDRYPPCVIQAPLGITGFADMDPYRTIGSQVWPPPPYNGGSVDMYIASDTTPGASGIGTQTKPFTDFRLAYSVVAAGHTLHISSGLYGGNIILSKPMNLVAQGGSVTIGGTVVATPVGRGTSPQTVCVAEGSP